MDDDCSYARCKAYIAYICIAHVVTRLSVQELQRCNWQAKLPSAHLIGLSDFMPDCHLRRQGPYSSSKAAIR